MSNDTNKAEYLKAAGMKLEMSTESSSDLAAAGLNFVDLAVMVKDHDYQAGQSQEEDVTVLASEAKENDLGLPDSGTVALAGHFPIGSERLTAILAANADKLPRVFKATYKNGAVFQYVARVNNYTVKSSAGGVVQATYNLRLTGKTEVKAPPAQGQGG